MPDRDAPVPDLVWERLRRMLAEIKAGRRSGPVVMVLNVKRGDVVDGYVLAPEAQPVVHPG